MDQGHQGFSKKKSGVLPAFHAFASIRLHMARLLLLLYLHIPLPLRHRSGGERAEPGKRRPQHRVRTHMVSVHKSHIFRDQLYILRRCGFLSQQWTSCIAYMPGVAGLAASCNTSTCWSSVSACGRRSMDRSITFLQPGSSPDRVDRSVLACLAFVPRHPSGGPRGQMKMRAGKWADDGWDWACRMQPRVAAGGSVRRDLSAFLYVAPWQY